MNDEDTPTYGDTILFRRYPGAHQESGRVIGRCKDRHGWRFDIETPDGNRFDNLTDVVLDQGEAEKLRRAELAAITGDAA